MSLYQSYTEDQLLDHLSQFLVSSWSYSAVSTFSRNQKAYEMQSVYGYRSKSSATTVAGNAYHEALQHYFNQLRESEKLPELVDLELIAYNYIDEVDPRDWKLQKTTPNVEECVTQASSTVSKLLQNFLTDISTYVDETDQVLEVEHYGKGIYVTINGVDIPLPLYYKIDLVIKTKDGKIVIIDHKSKQAYTPEEDIKLAHGKQAITYIKGYEEEFGLKVDEVWFIENKFSQNRDKSPQLIKYPLDMSTEDIRRYYEAMLYEGLRALVMAVNDPDYVYIMNDSDNYIDLAEMYEFWAKTLLSEVEDFTGIDPTKIDLIKHRLKKIKDTGIKTINSTVIKKFRQSAAEFIKYDYSNKDMTQEEKIEHVLRGFQIIARVAKIFDGYSSNTFLIEIGAGTKINSIQSRKLDLANALDVSSVRIGQNLTVWEGKSYLPVEVSKKRSRDLIFNKKDLVSLKIPIGKTNFEELIFWDFNRPSTPHAVVCGGTGSGKSVAVRSIIEYALLGGIDVEIFDLKNEFSNLSTKKKVSVFNDITTIEKRAEELVNLMNERIKKGISKPLLLVIEEFADAYLMMTKGKALDIMEEVQDGYYAPRKMKGPFGDYMSDPMPKMKMKATSKKNSLEENIQSLLQKGRSSGFHLLMATQRADAKTISGSAKVNLTVQICFKVQKATDSIVVLDEPGAESLSGEGDGLIRSPEYRELVRFQAYYKP